MKEKDFCVEKGGEHEGKALKDRLKGCYFCVERNQLRRFGHLIRMPPARLSVEVFRLTGRRPVGRPRTH